MTLYEKLVPPVGVRQSNIMITRCLQCDKQFTDLEADQLFDFTTGEFKCTHCGG